MAEILIQACDLGLNCLLPVNMLDPREAADGSYNIVYEKGLLRTAPGLSNWNTSTALNSGDTVLYATGCRINLSEYILAITREKIYRRDFTNAEWDDITQAGVTMGSSVDYPVSTVVISHDDSGIYLNEDSAQSQAYEHVMICDGGLSNIQRWAGEGETDCADVLGADGYSGGTAHRALQVAAVQNRLILISPREYDASSRLWVENRCRVRWPQVAKLQSWTGTGSGAVDLRDTGGINVWSAPLAGEFYIYQDNSIWNLRYVGSTTVFDPRPVVHDLGLLDSRLLAPHGNVHYFVGSDWNVYAYYGGTIKKVIGDKIKDFMTRDIAKERVRRCWLALDVNAERLGLFLVPSGGDYIGVLYWYDLAQGTWSKQDLIEGFPTGGITAVSLVASATGYRGETYRQALAKESLYEISDAGDATLRYGDVLCDASRTLTSEVTAATWCAGGTYLACATGAFLTDMTVGDILLVEDGSSWTNCRYGDHYYAIWDLSDTYITLVERDPSLGISDTTDIPAGVPFTVWTDDGDHYADAVESFKTADKLVIGDNVGCLYAFDESLSGMYEDTPFSAIHRTPVFDGGKPGLMKLWPGLRVTARNPISGATGVSYTNAGATTGTTYLLPKAVVSLEYTFTRAEDYVVYLVPQMDDSINGNPIGKAAVMNTLNDTVHLKCTVDGNWDIYAQTGSALTYVPLLRTETGRPLPDAEDNMIVGA